MTTPSAALPWGAGVPKTGVRSATILPPTPSRQLQARNQMLYVVVAMAGLAVLATAQQVIAKGWQAFVFRPPGVGGSPALDEDSKETDAKGMPAVQRTAPSTPTDIHHSLGHRRGHHFHRLGRSFAASTTGSQTLGQPAAPSGSGQATTTQPPSTGTDDDGDEPPTTAPVVMPPSSPPTDAGEPPTHRPPPPGRRPPPRPGRGPGGPPPEREDGA